MEREDIIRYGASACWIARGAFASTEFDAWMDAIPWKQNTLKMYGKEHLEPRLTAWMGPAYRYASIAWPERALTSEVSDLLEEINAQVAPARPLNACLFNLYRNGKDSMGWHRDNEPEIDPACIASVSFGAARDFVIRHRETKEKWPVHLQHGDLLVMENLQHDFDHALPKRLRVEEPRINCTFRTIRS